MVPPSLFPSSLSGPESPCNTCEIPQDGVTLDTPEVTYKANFRFNFGLDISECTLQLGFMFCADQDRTMVNDGKMVNGQTITLCFETQTFSSFYGSYLYNSLAANGSK